MLPLLYVIGAALLCWFVAKPLIYDPIVGEIRAKEKHKAMVAFIENEGTDEDKQRLKEHRRRMALLQLTNEEADLASTMLESPGVRAKLLGSHIDVQELQDLLASPSESAERQERSLLSEQIAEASARAQTTNKPEEEK